MKKEKMKKIYSFVLMAAMLLIGTNAWAAKTWSVGTADDFESAWTNAASGDKIQLTAAVTVTKTFWLGTENRTDTTSRSLEIDLNGWDLKMSAQYPFMLTHGGLKISNSRADVGGQLQGTNTSAPNHSNLFYISGTTDKIDASGDDYYTRLEIAEGVIVTQAYYDALITIVELNEGGVAHSALSKE